MRIIQIGMNGQNKKKRKNKQYYLYYTHTINKIKEERIMLNRKCGCNREPNYMMNDPVMEPTITKCIEKEFYHEVPQE